MENIVTEFEKRTGKKLKDREKGVLGELVQKDLLEMLKGNLSLSVKNERVTDLEGVTMRYDRYLSLKFNGEVVSTLNIN